MSDLFKKINTLVRAQIDGFLEDDLRFPRRRERHTDEAFDPTSKDAARTIEDMRQQIEKALSYEDDLSEQIDALHQDASDLDHQADMLVQAGQEEKARHTLEQLKRIERQIAMLEADLARHRQQTAALMDRVNVMETMTGAALAEAGKEVTRPAPEPASPAIDNPEINVPVTIIVEEDQPPEQDAPVTGQSTVKDEASRPGSTADDDDLAARRARLTQRPPDPQEE